MVNKNSKAVVEWYRRKKKDPQFHKAVRHYLVKIKKLTNFYGGYPLAQIRYIIYDGKRVN